MAGFWIPPANFSGDSSHCRLQVACGKLFAPQLRQPQRREFKRHARMPVKSNRPPSLDLEWSERFKTVWTTKQNRISDLPGNAGSLVHSVAVHCQRIKVPRQQADCFLKDPRRTRGHVYEPRRFYGYWCCHHRHSQPRMRSGGAEEAGRSGAGESGQERAAIHAPILRRPQQGRKGFGKRNRQVAFPEVSNQKVTHAH